MQCCESPNLIHDSDHESSRICQNCGYVIQSINLVSDSTLNWNENRDKSSSHEQRNSSNDTPDHRYCPTRPSVHLSSSKEDEKIKKWRDKLQNYGNRLINFSCSDSVIINKALLNYQIFWEHDEAFRKRRGDSSIVACLLFTLNQEKIPITLHEMAMLTGVDVYSLGDIVKQIKTIDAAMNNARLLTSERDTLSSENLISKLMRKAIVTLMLQDQASDTILISQALAVHKLIRKESTRALSTRRPDILCMAIVSLILGFQQCHKPSLKTLSKLASLVPCSSNTLMTLHGALVTFVWEKAIQIKVYSNLKRKDLYEFGNDLLSTKEFSD